MHFRWCGRLKGVQLNRNSISIRIQAISTLPSKRGARFVCMFWILIFYSRFKYLSIEFFRGLHMTKFSQKHRLKRHSLFTATSILKLNSLLINSKSKLYSFHSDFQWKFNSTDCVQSSHTIASPFFRFCYYTHTHTLFFHF